MVKKGRKYYDKDHVEREIEIAFTLCEAFQRRGIKSKDYLHKRLYKTGQNSEEGLLPVEEYQRVLKEISEELEVNYKKSDSLPRTFTGLLSHLKRKVKSTGRDYRVIGEIKLDSLDSEDDPLSEKNNPALARYFASMFRNPATKDYEHYQ